MVGWGEFLGYWTQFQHIKVGFPTPSNKQFWISLMSKNQLNSNDIHLKTSLDCTSRGLSPARLLPIPSFKGQFQLQVYHHSSGENVREIGNSHKLLVVQLLWKSLTISGKVKHIPSTRPSHSTPRYLTKRNKTIFQ